MITLIRVINPVEPDRGRETVEMRAVGETLLQILGGYSRQPITVSVNGHVWARDWWGQVTPKDGDYIVIAPVVGNGSVLRTLATVAVMVGAAAATYFTAGAGISIFGLGTSLLASLAGSIVAIGGNMLIAATMGPAAPSSKPGSSSYDPDGPRMLARSGTVIPKGYGTFAPGGNVISSFGEVAGNNQYIDVLVCHGFGPARSMQNIQINGKDIGTYQNVQMYQRLGANDQNPIPAFGRIVNGYPQSTKCLAGQPVIIPGTGTETAAIQIDMMLPAGLFWMDNGNLNSEVITYFIDYCESGTNNWVPFATPYETQDLVYYDSNGNPYTAQTWVVVPTDYIGEAPICYKADSGSHYPGEPWVGTISTEYFAPNGNHNTYNRVFTGEWQPLIPSLTPVLVTSWREGFIDFVANSNQPLYNRTTIYSLIPNKYDVRITKYGSAHLHDDVQPGDNGSPLVGEELWVHSVNEIQIKDLAYPNMVLLGVRALATNQLSGQNLNITAEITFGCRSIDEGRMPQALLAFEEDNPAVVCADMLIDDLYGGGIDPKRIERYIDEWVAWAEMNDELVDDGQGNSIRRHVFNGVLDNEASLWDQVLTVCRMSRAQVVMVGRDFGVFIDQVVDAPVQMFTMGNILMDSYSDVWLGIDDRANQVEIEIADRTRSYRTDNPMVYMDPALQDAGVEIKNVRIDGRGITIPAQAWHLARFKARSTALLLRSGQFRADTDAIACKIGSVVMLQHDVPEFGRGGRTLPGSTTTKVMVDSDDLPFTAGTSYFLAVQHAALQRYTGTVSAVAADTLTSGVLVSSSGWANNHRVTRAILAGTDCKILDSATGQVSVQPPPGFTPAIGQALELWDTDVLETSAVAGIDAVTGAVILSAPLSRVPADYSTYIYGEEGQQKLVRVLKVAKASEFRSTIEWIDYDPTLYTDATPVLGGVQLVGSKPGVSSLTGEEIIDRVGGNFVAYAKLSWRPGAQTAGVGIYGKATSGNSNPLILPLMLARLVAGETTWKYQVPVGETWTFTVVGFDSNNNYAPYKSAPSVSVAALGVAVNLLLGSSFATGFTYWNITPRAGDTFAPSFADDGQALYTIGSTALSAAQPLLFQVVQPAKWAVGEYLMLSGYYEDTFVTGGTANTGSVVLSIVFLDASGATLSTQTVSGALDGTTPTLKRINTAAVQIPTGTAQVEVHAAIGGTSPSMATGSTLELSHFLLEIVGSSVTAPSAWADIDVNGQILDIFTTGSSSGLRVQGSVLPSFTGTFDYTTTATGIVIEWTSLVILWPDGGVTFVQDGSMSVSGLSSSTPYFAYLYFDIVNGGVRAATPTTPVGTPAILSATADPTAAASCQQDNRVPLTPGGLGVVTAAPGGSGGGSGGGTGDPGDPPLNCTVRGTALLTPVGPVSNEVLKARFDRGEDVFLLARSGAEKIESAVWVEIPWFQIITVEGMTPFGASGSHTLRTRDGEHVWSCRVPDGSEVETTAGFRPVTQVRVDQTVEVLQIELVGPSHEYLVVEGVWTHNWSKRA